MRLAICISGETRSWGEYPSKNLAYFISTLEKAGHEVDVFGHTWDHCEQPSQEHVKFKKLVITDQDVIDEWVKEDWINRISLSHELCESYGYDQYNHEAFDMAKIKYENLSDDARTEILNSSRVGYAQFISAWTSFNLPDDTYDMYLRWRWDLIFSNTDSTSLMDDYKQVIDQYCWFYTEILVTASRTPYSSPDDLNVYFTGNTMIRNNNQQQDIVIDDTNFAFSKTARISIGHEVDNIYLILDEYINSLKNPWLYKWLDHKTWTWLMTSRIRMVGCCRLPVVTVLNWRKGRFKE